MTNANRVIVFQNSNHFLACLVATVSLACCLAAENRIQTENALLGTAEWRLSDPTTPGWPTNQDSTFPEIEGYASATSVNTNQTITFFVDVRVPSPSPTFSFEVFRMGWYGGLGARRMSWVHNGQPTQRVELPGVKQVVPNPDPITGRVECEWTPSYSLSVPSDWVSGVYVVKLTVRPLGRQSYMIFVVREDGRSSDFLYQSSVTTFQAYNPWGGRSAYPYPRGEAVEVSFDRPYAGAAHPFGVSSSSPRYDLAFGVGAGEFFTTIGNNPGPAWEYNLVRWLERQGFDLTYCTSIDTHQRVNLSWPGKSVKTFLSVGHDEYYSEEMRANVESARDRGMNLAFLGANACFYRAHFDPTSRRFVVRKTVPLNFDRWRGSFIRNPEISLIGVQYIFNTVDLDMRLPDPLPNHWFYDHTGFQPGEALPGLLGYEIDGEWDNYPTPDANVRPVPPPGTVQLMVTPFTKLPSQTGKSYATYYETGGGAKVFATGSMQWNWGLDDYNAVQTQGRVSRVSPKVRQATFNVLTKFRDAKASTQPMTFIDADTLTQGNWEAAYGVEGRAIADGRPLEGGLTNAAAIVNVGRHVPLVWARETTEPRALRTARNTDQRVAGAWTSTTSFRIDVDFRDSELHQVALYCVDWTAAGISQRIEVFDPLDPDRLLDVRDLRIPTNGVYLVWALSGRRTIRITNTGKEPGSFAAVSGLFLGADGTASFQRSNVGTATSGTRGDWITSSGFKRYGKEGYHLIGSRMNFPDYAKVTLNGVAISTWVVDGSDPRSLRLVDQNETPLSNRIAANWNSALRNFSFDLEISDGKAHEVSIYFYDWDGCTGLFPPRKELVEVVSPLNGRILDQRSLPVVGSDFCNGTYLSWLVRGHVRFRVTSLNPPIKPVISGLFFDQDPQPRCRIAPVPPPASAEELELSWDAIVGEVYEIEYTSSLSQPSWTVFLEGIEAKQNPEKRTIQAPTGGQQLFYRVVLSR